MSEGAATALRVTSLPVHRFDELLQLYRELHEHPELSLQEFRTARVMADRLGSLGFTVHAGVGGTGVVGVLENGDGDTVMLRADMDGLPIAEKTGLTYASAAVATDADGIATSVMHACGHDIHMVSMLGAAEVLATNRDDWRGTLVVVFQPAEENAVGAQAMIDDGLFSLIPIPAVVLGQHVGNLPTGTVSFTSGPAMAAADSLRVVITGIGAHGSRPQASVDPVLIAASIVMRLQSIVAREIAPADIAVVTVGSIHAGTKENIIPSTAELKLSLRSLTPEVRRRLLQAVHRIVHAECTAAGVETAPKIERIGSFPRVVNETSAALRTVAAFREHLTTNHVVEVPPITISEDFGIFGTVAQVESFFWFIGSTDPARYAEALVNDTVDRTIPANHSPLFAPEAPSTMTTGIDALLVAFSAWATPASMQD